MPRIRKAVPVREPEEAWELALANKGLVMSQLFKFLNSHDNLVWYKGDDLRAELESVAWEGMYNACLLWEPSKGRLSTYAVPAIRNTMLQALDKLMKMGGNQKGGQLVKLKYEVTPPVFSLDSMSEARAKNFDAETVNSYADEIPQPWQDTETDEEKLLTRLDNERMAKKIEELTDRMPEPHQSVFRLMALTPDDGLSPGRGQRIRYSAMGIRKACLILHYADDKVRDLWLEALDWMELQLEAAGYGEEISG